MTNHPPSVLWHCWLGHQTCKNRRPYNLYCVGAGVKPCSINSSSGSVNTWMGDRLWVNHLGITSHLGQLSISSLRGW